MKTDMTGWKISIFSIGNTSTQMVDVFIVMLVFGAVNLHDLEQLINAILTKTRWHKETDWTMLDLKNTQLSKWKDLETVKWIGYHTCLY